MASTDRTKHFNEIVRRALDASDPIAAAAYRDRLLSDPDALIREEGYDLRQEEVAMLKNITAEAVDRTAHFVSSAVDSDPTTA